LKSLVSTDSSISHEQIAKNISKIVLTEKSPDNVLIITEKSTDHLYKIAESENSIDDNRNTFQLDYSIRNNEDEAFNVGEFSRDIDQSLAKKLECDLSYKHDQEIMNRESDENIVKELQKLKKEASVDVVVGVKTVPIVENTVPIVENTVPIVKNTVPIIEDTVPVVVEGPQPENLVTEVPEAPYAPKPSPQTGSPDLIKEFKNNEIISQVSEELMKSLLASRPGGSRTVVPTPAGLRGERPPHTVNNVKESLVERFASGSVDQGMVINTLRIGAGRAAKPIKSSNAIGSFGARKLAVVNFFF